MTPIVDRRIETLLGEEAVGIKRFEVPDIHVGQGVADPPLEFSFLFFDAHLKSAGLSFSDPEFFFQVIIGK